MSILFILIPSIIIGITTYFIWIWTYWRRRGIPGPMGIPFFGNTNELIDHNNPPHKQIQKWTQEFGSVYGITEGLQKTLVISDTDLINEVFVKQFDNFYGRKLNPLQGDPDKDKRIHLFASQGYRWKRLRTISSPTFSNNSLRKIHSTVEECALELMRHIEQKTAGGKEIDMLLFYQEFTFDVIERIAMGQTESQMFNNPFIEDVKAIFGDRLTNVIKWSTVFPFYATIFKALAKQFSGIVKSPAFAIFTRLEKIIEKRMKQREEDEKNGIEIGEPADFIDLFLDARADVDMLEEEKSQFTKMNIKVDRQLTVDEIIGQCFVFLLAGFDTTALTLSYTTFLLATNPRTMKKMQEEIDRECPDPSVSFDQLFKLKYLECAMKEALRMYPIAQIANNRKCMKATKIGKYEIEEGVNVQADSWTLHYDKKIWGEDADEFKPERWEHGDEQFYKNGWLPFGLGPRQCIGMRLAYMEEKLLLSHILRKYSFETTHNTQIPLKLIGRSTTGPESVVVKLVPRY